MAPEASRRAHVMDEVIGDGVIGADPFHASSMLRVGAPIAQEHVLRMPDRNPAARYVGDMVADDLGVDDVVRHRDPFATAVLDDVADELDGVGAVDVDHGGEGIDDLVLARVPITTSVSGEDGGPLYGGFASRIRNAVQIVVCVCEG